MILRALAILIVATATSIALGQAITSVSPSTAFDSERLIIVGSGFGTEPGIVEVGGVEAPVSFWSDTKVRAYVPMGVALGSSDVAVTTSGGAPSNAVGLEITTRPAQPGRIQWRITIDDDLQLTAPAVAPDGTVYAAATGLLYAITPDGSIKWIRTGVAANRPISIALDGTIYVTGAGGSVSALDPTDGSTIWSWQGVGSVFVGPNVGPDGNIYGVTDILDDRTETGAFVLSPGGELLFSEQGGYAIRGTPLAWSVAFTDQSWFITSGMGYPAHPDAVYGMFAFDLGGGGPVWTTGGLGQAFGLPSGNVAVNDPGGNRIATYGPTGTVEWAVSLNTLGGPPTPPGVASDGTFYIPIQSPARFHAVDSDGTIRWSRFFESIRFPVVRSDGSAVVAYESRNLQPTLINAYDAADGSILWSQEIDMNPVHNLPVSPGWYGVLSADNHDYYTGTAYPVTGDDSFSFFYAIDARIDGDAIPGDLDGDGDVDLQDLATLLANYPCVSGDCPGDVDGDGDTDLSDLAALLGAYGTN